MDGIGSRWAYPIRTAPLAVQFTGGEEQANDIIHWLGKYDIEVEWSEQTDTRWNTKEYIISRQEYRGPHLEAEVDDWLILEPNGTLTVLTDKAMKATYKGI